MLSNFVIIYLKSVQSGAVLVNGVRKIPLAGYKKEGCVMLDAGKDKQRNRSEGAAFVVLDGNMRH
ncbi:hypothetical protein TS65_09035 [Aneurinibacillus migulanus]|uniref:Uncharacterized protein n=1 Tax=Aneurinibacillus migulanus TaxID=47500 RepID=A0A0D1YFJ2_ANEMI|nr:hypothetical protein TS65_09035 [Aneurinibacillus migulanus]KON95882.1 hypothetical protein AF333_10710 [Aneurinibacillus migulanus]GED17563.1 hypothetical protein AMI01nite_55540 [Aneurinibacillus migulanus]SDK27158.1 hypothetical protein SAMN04487909_14649 [Aneurinibacillus migulanus]